MVRRVAFDLAPGSSRRHGSHSDVLDAMKSRYPCIYQPINHPSAGTQPEEEEYINEDRRYLTPLYVFGT
ncbi:NIN-like protein [Artemisia annua]|uniref:NIN-like protein n=1 Tax=Artemisia annua TaxID=35608 RepID=A0A2U1MJX0_ARTAN|nr:NIN-like protein [Artemisia annua]